MKKSTVLNPTPSPRDIEAGGSFAGIDMPFKQTAAFATLMHTIGNDEFTTAAKVISVGLRCEHRGPQGWIHLSATRCVYPEEAVEAFIRRLSEQRPEFNLPGPSRPKIIAGVME